MRDDGYAARPEARIVGRTRDPVPELGRERAVHRREVDADLLEHAALHDRHLAAAPVAAVFRGPLPDGALEPAGRSGASFVGVLERLEGGAEPVAEGPEPRRSAFLPGFDGHLFRPRGAQVPGNRGMSARCGAGSIGLPLRP